MQFVDYIDFETILRQEKDKEGYVEHLVCNGSRFHVISWDNFGEKCSCKNCEINKARKIRIKNTKGNISKIYIERF